MSDAIPSGPAPELTPEQQGLRDRKAVVVKEWTRPENWSEDGNDWLREDVPPPWGSRPRCPVVRNGHHCRKSAIPGGRVCTAHGGAAPQVKRKAQLNMLKLVAPTVVQLGRVITQPADQRTLIAAARLVFDVNGMLTKGVDQGSAELGKALLLERLLQIKQDRAKAEQEALAEIEADVDLSEDVVDADVVDELHELTADVSPVSSPAPDSFPVTDDAGHENDDQEL